MLTNWPLQHIFKNSNGHISAILRQIFVQLHTVTQVDFRHILSENEALPLYSFRENKMAAQNFKKSFGTEVVEVPSPNLVG